MVSGYIMKLNLFDLKKKNKINYFDNKNSFYRATFLNILPSKYSTYIVNVKLYIVQADKIQDIGYAKEYRYNIA